jgi:apolipoprotein N-acyltransferase
MHRALPWILAALSGIVLALAMPGPGLWPLMLVFPGLLLEALERGEGRWKPWLLGWLAGTVHWVVATHWVHEVMHHYGGLSWILAGAALVGMGAILATTWALIAGLTARIAPVWRPCFLPFAWVAVDTLRRFQPFQFPWNDVAAVVADRPALLGSLPIWGASGLGWAVVALGAGAWGIVRADRRRSSGVLVVVAGALVVVASLLAPQFEASGPAVRIAVLQPGTTLEEKWDPGEWQVIADRVWTMTRRAADDGAKIVLWPESAVPFRIDTDPEYRRIVSTLAAELGIEIVLNSVGELRDGGYTNSAYLVTELGISPARYDKVHLVPFGEYVPPWAELVTTDALVREVGTFTPGSSTTPLPARVPLGMSICYEVVFSGHSAAQVRNGAELLVTVTNDGWYGFSWAPVQHLAQVRLRAVEHRRWFARAALTGISGFVDPNGRLVDEIDIGEQGLLVAELPPSTALPPRSRWGDWWAWVCAAATVGMLAIRVGQNRRNRE